MKTITPYLITKLYTWTVRDLNLIYDKCFTYNHKKNFEEGPSSSFALLLAALIETWGAIIRDRFGKSGETDCNVKIILEKICELDEGKNKANYKIFSTAEGDQNLTRHEIVKIFRHNLIHDFGKKQDKPEYDLNIDTIGLAIDQQGEKDRWHINCKKLKEDFLNLLRIELPNLIKEENSPRF